MKKEPAPNAYDRVPAELFAAKWKLGAAGVSLAETIAEVAVLEIRRYKLVREDRR